MELTSFTTVHFLRPQVLWLLPFAWLGLWWLARRYRRRDGWQSVVDAHLLPAIRVRTGGRAGGLLRLAMLVVSIGILALAGPSWQKQPVPVVKNQHALVIALDLSRSMLADDIKPNRLQRAKFKLEDLLKRRTDGQTGLVVWAGESFVVTPLTDDNQTIIAMLSALDPSIMPVQGSRASTGLAKAADLIQQAGHRQGDIVLITDGVDMPQARGRAAELKKRNLRIHVLGVGTPTGAPIPVRGGFHTDRQGQIVMAKLEEETLRQVAEAGGGLYRRLSADDSDLNALLASMDHVSGSKNTLVDEQDKRSEQWVDQGYWLLLLLVPLMALMYRKGWLLAMVLAIGVHGMPAPVMAQMDHSTGTQDQKEASAGSRWQRWWNKLWYNHDQQAAKALQEGRAGQASELARDPRWKAAAEYKSGRFRQADQLWRHISQPVADDWYNRGNALARAGQLEAAIGAYDQALALDPRHEDAAHNKKVVEEALRQSQQNPQDSSGNDAEDSQAQAPPSNQGDNQQQEQQNQSQAGQATSQQRDGRQDDREDKGGPDTSSAQEDGQNDQSTSQSDASDRFDDANTQEHSGAFPEQQQQAQAMEAEQRQAEEKVRAQSLASNQDGDEKDEDEVMAARFAENAQAAEKQQAMEQWLRRVPDDPGGLLRRKFQHQYRQWQLDRQVDKNAPEQDW